MRANEFIRESREDVEGITIEMKKHGHQLVINALDDWGNKLLGFVIFNIGDSNELDPQELEVVDKYQGQGIARVMYDYVKSKGYKIVRSHDQTDAGKGFWDKHRGEDVKVWEQGVTESLIYELAQEEVAPVGINVKTDKKAKRSYADLIVDGEKKYESRKGKSLMPFVGKTVSIIRTGNGPAKAIGSATVGQPIVVNEKQFRQLESAHLVPQGSAFDIERGSYKYLYPMLNPHRYYKEYDVSNEGSIFVSRKVIK